MALTKLDDALYSVGKYGRYQLVMSVIITTVGTLFPAWQMMGIIFSADRPNSFHCTNDLPLQETAQAIDNNNNKTGRLGEVEQKALQYIRIRRHGGRMRLIEAFGNKKVSKEP